MTLRTENELRNAADQYANQAIEINEIKAAQATELNDLKKRYKAKLDPLTKEANSMKGKIKRFVVKNALKLFNKESGSLKTQQTEIKLRNNPPKIKQLDPSMTEETLIQRAKASGFRSVLLTKEVISKEALERLSADDLETIGYYKVSDQTFDILPLAEPKAKSTSKIKA